jgi:hypothetical protein
MVKIKTNVLNKSKSNNKRRFLIKAKFKTKINSKSKNKINF